MYRGSAGIISATCVAPRRRFLATGAVHPSYPGSAKDTVGTLSQGATLSVRPSVAGRL